MATNNLSRFSVGGLTTAQVDARVVAVASGTITEWLKPGRDLINDGANPALANTSLDGAALFRANTYTFSASVDQNCGYSFPFPEKWDIGTVRCRFYWRPSNTNTGVCRWRMLSQTSAADLEAISSTIVNAVTVDDAGGGTANILQITDWTPLLTITAAGSGKLNNLIFQRQGSHAADTFSGTSLLIGIQLQWQSNAPTDD